MKRLLALLITLTMAVSILAGCSKSADNTTVQTTDQTTDQTTVESTDSAATEAKPVTLEVVASQPEYLAQEQEIWNLYMEQNPNVTIELTSVNEDTSAAFNTQVASGDAPDIQCYVGVLKDSYQTYQNLADIDYPYWDLIQYDAKNVYSESNGTEEGYVPALYPFSGVTFSFIYHKDEMDKAGLSPRDSVRTMADLDAFLADLKTYVDSQDEIKYTLDMGWHSWCIFVQEIDELAVAMGTNQEVLKDLWINKKIQWTDVENNPYVPAFKKLKEWYDLGYLPEKWWTRNWESDFEAGFTAKSSILAFHGPWLWTKVETADPNVTLSGFPMPANADGIIQNGAVEPGKGSVLFACNKDGEKQAEAVKAFIWWNSPEVIKMRAEAFGSVPLMDLSSVGQPEIASSQYNEVIAPIQQGFFGDVTFDSSLWASTLVGKYKNKDAADVMAADDMAVNFGDYFEGKITLEALLQILQDRYDLAYTIE